MEKAFRGIINLFRVLIIKLRCGSKVEVSCIQPMRLKAQLFIKNNCKKVIIGNHFKLETDAKVRVMDDGELIVGDNCFINCGSYITVMGKTTIGNNCLFGPNVMIFDHDHDFRVAGGISSGNYKIGEISIGNNVWIGAGCIILKGANIGDNCVIAAGSIVNRKVEANTIFMQKRTNVVSAINRV